MRNLALRVEVALMGALHMSNFLALLQMPLLCTDMLSGREEPALCCFCTSSFSNQFASFPMLPSPSKQVPGDPRH